MAAAKKSIKIQVEDLDAEEEKPAAKKATKKKPEAKAKKAVKKPAVKKTAIKKNILAEGEEKSVISEGERTAAKAAVAKELEKSEKKDESDFDNLIEKAIKEEKDKSSKNTKGGKKKVKGKEAIGDMEIDPVLKVINTVNEEKEEQKISPDTEDGGHTRQSIKMYRKIAYFFIVLTILLIFAVLYFAVVKVRIGIIPTEEKLSNNMIFDVYDIKNEGIDDNAIKGEVKKVRIEHEEAYRATGEKIIGEETVGTITLINNYSKNQQLVATTRILSPEGKLFRLKNTVNVPAGSKVGAEVYADKPGQDTAIAPTKFTIPGLWAGLQDKIYAESDKAFVYRQKVTKHIQEIDIENGIRDLKQQLLAKTKVEVSNEHDGYSQVLYRIDDDSIKSEYTAKAGEEVDQFTIKMSADVVVAAFPEDKAIEIAKQKFIASLPQNKEVLNFDDENIVYSLNSYDLGNGVATINSNFIGRVTLKENSQIIDVGAILGLNDEQLRAYLSGLNEIAGYEVEYFPSFIKRVPRLVDRVKVEIKLQAGLTE